jgi:hypothetical protein
VTTLPLSRLVLHLISSSRHPAILILTGPKAEESEKISPQRR